MLVTCQTGGKDEIGLKNCNRMKWDLIFSLKHSLILSMNNNKILCMNAARDIEAF